MTNQCIGCGISLLNAGFCHPIVMLIGFTPRFRCEGLGLNRCRYTTSNNSFSNRSFRARDCSAKSSLRAISAGICKSALTFYFTWKALSGHLLKVSSVSLKNSLHSSNAGGSLRCAFEKEWLCGNFAYLRSVRFLTSSQSLILCLTKCVIPTI